LQFRYRGPRYESAVAQLFSLGCFAMRADHTKVIAELQAHDFRSLQFFNVAAGYFERRLRSVRVGCLFCFFLAIMGAAFCFIPSFPWWLRIFYAVCSVCVIQLCWYPFHAARHGLRMIKAARHLDQYHQLDCLEVVVLDCKTRKNMRHFWGVDPIAIYILRALRHERPAA
jgi:hypothetical protein